MNRLIFKVAPTLTSWAPTRCFSTASSVAPLFRLHSVQPIEDKSKVASLQTDSASFGEFALDSNNDVYELCAVPKKRVSLHVRKVRREGHWQAKLKTLYKPYRICLQCGQAVMPHFVCKRNPNCASMPRV